MSVVVKFCRMSLVFASLLAMAAGCAKGKNKSYDDDGGSDPTGSVASGGGGAGSADGQQLVTIETSLRYRQAFSLLANATAYTISLEGCATGYTSTADEASTALQVYKFDRGCKAKLTTFQFGGKTYTPTVGDPFTTWDAGDTATFDEAVPAGNAITVKVVSQLADPVAGVEAVVYSFSEIVKGADQAVMEAILGAGHPLTVASEPPPSFTIKSVDFVGVNAQGGGQFIFVMECTSTIGVTDVCEQVDMPADITYRLVEDTYSDTMDIGEANALFPVGESPVTFPTERVAPGGSGTANGGFVTVTLDGPDQMALNPNMILILQAADTSYQYFNVDVATLTQD